MKTILTVLNFNWLKINLIGGSIISRSLLSLSLLSFLIVTLYKTPFGVNFAKWNITYPFVGSLVFFVGWLFAIITCPSELKKETDLNEITSKMAAAGPGIFADRLIMLYYMIGRFQSQPPVDLPSNLLFSAVNAHRDVASHTTSAAWGAGLAHDVYRYDVALRSYDKPAFRFIVASLMMFGLILMFLPTMVNILVVIYAIS